MKENGVDDGHILLINSMSGHRVKIASPDCNGHFYTVTKFATTALTEGIRNELREMKSNIRVTAISPGRVDTEFILKMAKDEEIAAHFCNSIKCLHADDIADALVYALGTPKHVQVHDILLRPTEQVS